MSMCEGWRIWQHNYNPNIRLLVPETVAPETVGPRDEIPTRTPMFSDLDIHEVTYNQTVDAGTFPAKGLLEHYHPETRRLINILGPIVAAEETRVRLEEQEE